MSVTKLALCFVLFVYQDVKADSRINPLVDTKVGSIKGLKASDDDYAMFLGIPFGKVDAANPFGLSTPYPPFDDVFEAYDDSAICPQKEEINKTIVGTIDCLHLNVYVPTSANSKNLLPVLVWIYGGGFSFGFAGRTLYGPKYLVKHDVIVVSLNYRLGPYGFMCLNTPEVPGNQGLKDQLLALRWVKNNIEAFGGNVNQITIFGESAGGISVDLHLYSRQEQLFTSVILQSGSALLPNLFKHDSSITNTLRLAEKLGLNTSDVSQALTFLADADPKAVIAATLEIDGVFNICVEKDFDGVEKVYGDYAYNLDIPKAKNMSILIGFNAQEWFFNFVNRSNEFYAQWNDFKEKLDNAFDFNETDLEKMADIVRNFYIGDEKVGNEVNNELSQFHSDFWFNYPASKSVDKYIDNGASKVFYYMFSYFGGRNWVRRQYNITEGTGAVHADELGYLFDNALWNEKPSQSDQVIIDRMTTLWSNFVKYGDPTPETSDLIPVKWEPIVTKDSPHYYLNIDSELTLGTRPYNDRIAFWDLFYSRNEKFQRGYKEK